jgi:hypothetical protein
MKPIEFEPHGPFPIKYNGRGERIRFDRNLFWDSKASKFGDRRGCYVFGVKRGKTILPFYVGETKVRFQGEIFEPHKQAHYRRALSGGKAYKAFIFLIVQPLKKKPNRKFITDVEHFFIRVAWRRNPSLRNHKGIPAPEWTIPGVTAPAKGKPTQAVRALRQLTGLEGNELHAGQRRPAAKSTKRH